MFLTEIDTVPVYSTVKKVHIRESEKGLTRQEKTEKSYVPPIVIQCKLRFVTSMR